MKATDNMTNEQINGFGNFAMEKLSAWIQDNMDPENIFPEALLKRWAVSHLHILKAEIKEEFAPADLYTDKEIIEEIREREFAIEDVYKDDDIWAYVENFTDCAGCRRRFSEDD